MCVPLFVYKSDAAYDNSRDNEKKKKYKDHPARRDNLGINMSVIDYDDDNNQQDPSRGEFHRDSRQDSVIVPARKRAQDISVTNRKILKIQEKVLSHIGCRGEGVEKHETKQMLDLFRSCQPDEYGCIT